MSELKGQKKAEEKHEAEVLAEAQKLKQVLEADATVVEIKAKLVRTAGYSVRFLANKLPRHWNNSLILRLINGKLS